MAKSSQNHSFDVKIACHIGILAATVLNHIHYWIKHNHIEGTGQAEEKTWTFQSVTKMQEYLPYLTEKQVRTSLDLLEEHGYIIKGNFNKNRFDHTAWYTLPEEALTSIVSDLPCRANRSSEKGKSSGPPGQIKLPPRANPSIYNKDMKEDTKEIHTDFLSFGSHVNLKRSEYTELIRVHGKELIDKTIEDVNNYCAAHGKTYKSYAAGIRTFLKNYKAPIAKHSSAAAIQPSCPNELTDRLAMGGRQISHDLYRQIKVRAERENKPENLRGWKYRDNETGEMVIT
jgi:hypothetical protein